MLCHPVAKYIFSPTFHHYNALYHELSAAHVREYALSGHHQRMAQDVSDADVGEFPSSRRSEFFFKGEKIRKRLARMVDIRQCINDGNTRKRRQGVENILLEYARDDSVHPTRKTPGNIGNRFALA